jgi:hypothetical protein
VICENDIEFFNSLDDILNAILKTHFEEESTPEGGNLSVEMLPFYEAVALSLLFQRILASEFLDLSKTSSSSKSTSLDYFGKIVSISTSQLAAGEQGRQQQNSFPLVSPVKPTLSYSLSLFPRGFSPSLPNSNLPFPFKRQNHCFSS